ncbi:MAG: SDR family NAD(P)-dependent oxidoreductase [Clostridia bacterium]|nr:SDR family NAD(P)-dependent oxidoreductase [Clostridia bacterium]
MQKTAIVSGTDHGLGASLVTELVYRGYRVIAGRLCLEKETADGQTVFLPLDLSDQGSIERFAARAGELAQNVDLLINNAGILGDMRSTIRDRLDRDDIRRVIEVNAIGTLMLTNALYPLIEKGEGKTVVNISSEAGSVSECWRESWFGYCMSKAANNMQGALVHNLLRKIGGQVVQMHPGHVRSYMRGHLDETGKLTSEESARYILKTLLDGELPREDRPLYIDYEGRRLSY